MALNLHCFHNSIILAFKIYAKDFKDTVVS